MEHHSLFLHLWVDFSVLTEVGAASYQPRKADVVISCHKLVGLSLESLNALPQTIQLVSGPAMYKLL